MNAQLIRRDVVPFALGLTALVAAALLLDWALHRFAVVWVGRYLGIPGTILIVASFGYSMRKRKLIRSGSPVTLLRWHEGLAWLGSLMVLVHAGIHFNAILPWLATAAMMVNVASGLAGKLLLDRSRRRLEEARAELKARGAQADVPVEADYWDALTFDAVRKWRVVHFPITLAFCTLALAHILSIFLFWGWR